MSETQATYNPVTGDGYTTNSAHAAWSASMTRSRPAWQLRGGPGEWHWSWFDFKPWTGRVTVESDGFHWETRSYDSGETIHKGVTTSVYVAYQSVIRNEPTGVPSNS